ncbi:MAG: metal-dependent transcriptional regulator [Acutalibacteraceae bacterium]
MDKKDKREEEFYTLKGYEINRRNTLTSAMEDYLEMIYRTAEKGEEVHLKNIASYLNVKPSSATKMISNLKENGYITSEKYGKIFLTEKGREKGRYLLYRHNVVNDFLSLINGSISELEQAEKIEHFLDERTVKNIALFTKKIKEKDIL